uniref:BTB domain-containing protein n=1 Tax=Haemonchus contortus TaxID=6289 RepID=A0A7I4YXB8_HAECO
MTSFFKKLSRNRSKSPQKTVPPYMTRYMYGPPPHEDLYEQNRRGNPYEMNEYGQYPPVCYLPLPPSPLIHRRNHDSGLSIHHSNQSNESVGVHSWNTERSDFLARSSEPWRDVDMVKPSTRESNTNDSAPQHFYLPKDHNSNFDEPSLFEGPSMNGIPRTRSHSPRKERRQQPEEKTKSRSKSPQKHRSITNSFDYLNSQCHLEGCSASIVVNSTRFLICRHQLCHASEYFKNLFLTHRRNEDVHVAVSGMTSPSPATQFRWFVESCIPCPALRDITDDTLETCMRLSRRFQASGLVVRCSKFIRENVHNRQPIVALCWLNWCLKHRYDEQVQLACMPVVARLSLASLEQHRHMMSERVFADIIAAKLRGCYEKAVHVFRTIHRMDHFSVDMDRCPRCGRIKDGMKVKVNADPCRKQIGCDRCHREGCEIEEKAGEDLQAYYQCPHGLLPLNDTTEECHCQSPMLAIHLGSAYPPKRPDEPTDLRPRSSSSPTRRKN